MLLTNDEKIKILNRDWRGKDRPTDVLSFPLLKEEELKILGRWAKGAHKVEPWDLGDIVISIDTAKAQAKEKKIKLAKELEILLVHGILHLLGYDHEKSPKEAKRMHRLEKILLGT